MNDLYIGILSGTSMDAIDVAAVHFPQEHNNSKPNIYAAHSTKLPAEYKQKYFNIINSGGICTLEDLGALDSWTGDLFANAIIEFLNIHNIDKNQIAAIGSHGQTLWHAPKSQRPFTMQIGDPNIIAVKTGIPTIADFRRANIAAGGQGAPLAPALHKAIFSSKNESRCIVNIGGFSNISVLTADKYFGFDTGPGNCLMDFWAKQYFNLDYDIDGKIAASGIINETLLKCLLDDPYLKLPDPKSTGREYFNPQWLSAKLIDSKQQESKPEDVLATLLFFTAKTIAIAIDKYTNGLTSIFVCGGGAYNLHLLDTLRKILNREIQTTGKLGIEPIWVETVLFAWMAKQTLMGKSIDLPTSYNSKQVVLGGIYGKRDINELAY